ncbi:MAG: hypothetical protein Q8904_10675 [Bacteroidota bacterium]|nr:hypothetical protein [Bacteroidota bacterium]
MGTKTMYIPCKNEQPVWKAQENNPKVALIVLPQGENFTLVEKYLKLILIVFT